MVRLGLWLAAVLLTLISEIVFSAKAWLSLVGFGVCSCHLKACVHCTPSLSELNGQKQHRSFFKKDFIILCVWVFFLHQYLACAWSQGGRKRALDLLELETQMMEAIMYVLRIKLKSSGKTASPLNHWAIIDCDYTN